MCAQNVITSKFRSQSATVAVRRAGDQGAAGLGDGGPGTTATISYVDGLAALGPDVVFSDLFKERVRALTR